MICFKKDFFLQGNTGNLVIFDKNVLSDCLDGKLLCLSRKSSKINLSEGTFTQLHDYVKVL